jgi:hypothetical protein
MEKDVLAMPKIWLKFWSTIIVSHGRNLMLCSSDIHQKPLSLLQIYENPPISVFKWFQHLRFNRSHSLKKNQNKKTVDPNYFKNHKEPIIYRNEPINNHQFTGQLFQFFNFLRIVITYEILSFDFSRTTAMYPKNYLVNYWGLFLLITTQHLLEVWIRLE